MFGPPERVRQCQPNQANQQVGQQVATVKVVYEDMKCGPANVAELWVPKLKDESIGLNHIGYQLNAETRPRQRHLHILDRVVLNVAPILKYVPIRIVHYHRISASHVNNLHLQVCASLWLPNKVQATFLVVEPSQRQPNTAISLKRLLIQVRDPDLVRLQDRLFKSVPQPAIRM